jgi:hypothetical protein
MMFPHLGPEFIAAMQEAWGSAKDSRSSTHLPSPSRNDETVIPLMALSFSLGSSNSRTLSLRNVWVSWHP